MTIWTFLLGWLGLSLITAPIVGQFLKLSAEHQFQSEE